MNAYLHCGTTGLGAGKCIALGRARSVVIDLPIEPGLFNLSLMLQLKNQGLSHEWKLLFCHRK